MECSINIKTATGNVGFKYNTDLPDIAVNVDLLVNKLSSTDLHTITNTLIDVYKSSQGVESRYINTSNIANTTSQELFSLNSITYTGKRNVQVVFVNRDSSPSTDVDLRSASKIAGQDDVYVVRSRSDMINLAKYLSVLDGLDDSKIPSGLKSKIIKYLQGEINFTPEEITEIDTKIREILNTPLKTDFNDVFANAIIHSIKRTNGNDLLKKSTIFTIFKNKINGDKDASNELKLILDKKTVSGADCQLMLNYIFKDILTDKIIVGKVNGLFLLVNRTYPTIGDLYGDSIKPIIESKIKFNTSYRGEVISSFTDKDKKTKYMISRFYPTISSRIRIFDTIQEAQEAIDNTIGDEFIIPSTVINTLLGYTPSARQLKSDFFIDKLLIVPSSIDSFKDIANTVSSIHIPEDLDNYSNFIKWIDKNNFFSEDLKNSIKLICDTTFKASLFLYAYKKGMNVKDIIENLKNKDESVYYLRIVDGKLLATKTDKTLGLTAGKTTPTNNISNISIMSIITSSLAKLFNVKFELYSEQALDENGKEIKGSNQANAFIYNGTIYINLNKANVSDAIHECMHLLVPYFRNNSHYLNFLNDFSNNETIIKELNEMNKGLYEGLAYNDKLEELFVKYLSLYVTNSPLDDNLKSLFNKLAKEEKIETPDNTDGNVISVGNSKIANIGLFFPLINKAIHDFTNDNSNAEYRRRRAVNALREDINKGDIIEDCK